MVATFPWARVAALGRGAAWAGRLNIGGDDADSCPDDAGPADVKNGPVKKATFPAAWYQ